MQEKQSAPRIGRDAHVANERRVRSKVKALTIDLRPACICDWRQRGRSLDIPL